MLTLTTGPAVPARTRVALTLAAVFGPLAVAYAAILLARTIPAHAPAIFFAGIALGIIGGSVCVARSIQVRLAAFIAVLVYLALTLPFAFYFFGWWRCVVLGDCL